MQRCLLHCEALEFDSKGTSLSQLGSNSFVGTVDIVPLLPLSCESESLLTVQAINEFLI